MKRTLYLKMTVDWEDYDDVCDELILEDSGAWDGLKYGVNIELFSREELVKSFEKYVQGSSDEN